MLCELLNTGDVRNGFVSEITKTKEKNSCT